MIPTTPVSPKAVWGALVTLLVSIVLAILAAPGLLDYLDALPPFVQFIIMAAIPPVVSFLGAYAKRDPLRDAGAIAVDQGRVAAPNEAGDVL